MGIVLREWARRKKLKIITPIARIEGMRRVKPWEYLRAIAQPISVKPAKNKDSQAISHSFSQGRPQWCKERSSAAWQYNKVSD